MKLIKNTGFFLLVAVLLLSLAPVAYRLIPFGSGRTVDTAYAKGSIRVDSVLRIVALSKADTNWVLGVNDSGFLCWRYRAGSGYNFATANLSLTADRAHDANKYNIRIDSARTFNVYDTAGALVFGMPANGANYFLVNHLAGVTPMLTGTLGTGAGTGASYAISGTDLGGYVSVTTGTGCATDATIITLPFGKAFAAAPHVILVAGDKLTRNLAKGQEAFIDVTAISTSSFVIKSNGTALADATTYRWQYIIVQ